MTCSQRNQKTFSLQAAVSIFGLKGLAPFCFFLGKYIYFFFLTFHQLGQLIIPHSFLGATGSKEYSVYLMLSSFLFGFFFSCVILGCCLWHMHAFVAFFLRYKNLKALILASSLHFDQLIKGEVFCPNYVPLGSLSIFMQILPKLFIIQATYKYLFMVSL